MEGVIRCLSSLKDSPRSFCGPFDERNSHRIGDDPERSGGKHGVRKFLESSVQVPLMEQTFPFSPIRILYYTH